MSRRPRWRGSRSRRSFLPRLVSLTARGQVLPQVLKQLRDRRRPEPAEISLRQHAVQGKILLVADAVLSGEPHLAGLPILGDRAEMRYQDNRRSEEHTSEL